MKLKLNYGWFIFCLYGGFVILMGVLFFKCRALKVDVISKDYYAEELVYQQQIDKQQRTQLLPEQPTWIVTQDEVQVHFPSAMSAQSIQGKVDFFCPSDDTKDMSFDIKLNKENAFSFPRKMLKEGRYKLKLNWNSGKENYYNEGVIRIDS